MLLWKESSRIFFGFEKLIAVSRWAFFALDISDPKLVAGYRSRIWPKSGK